MLTVDEVPGMPLLGALLMVLGSAAHGATPRLSPVEQRIVAAAASEDDRAIAFLETLVNVNSGTMNFAGVEHVGRLMAAELQPLGFTTRWHSMSNVGRSGHLIAEHRGSGRGKRLLLIGHLDTVFEQDSPFQHYQRRGNVAEGPGVCDMKGGLAIMVAALRALRTSDALRAGNVTIVLDGDEENAGSPLAISRADLIEAAKNADVALEFEALATKDGHDMGSVSRRGAVDWTLRTSAASGHSSEIFSATAGFGASYELARILDGFRRELREPNATYNVGLVLGGSDAALNGDVTGGSAHGKGNVIAAQGIARGDLRTLSNEQTTRLETKMRAIVADHLPGTDAQIQFDEGYPAMAPTAGNRALLARLNEINMDLGLEPMAELDPLERGAGDISFVTDRVDGLVGFGAVGHGSHAPGETADLSSLDRQIKRAALMIERLSQVR